MIRLKSGDLRHEITIWKNDASSTNLDDIGRATISERKHATVRASIKKLTGNELTIAHQEFSKATHEILCWYVPKITTQMWLIGFNGKRYNIVDVDNEEEKNHILKMLVICESS